MKVLLLIKGLGRGGAEQLLSTSAPYLDRGRFSYQVAFVRRDKDALVGELRSAGLRVECLGSSGDARWTANLRSLVKRDRIDLIHAHSPAIAAAARVIFPRRSGIRFVYTEHGPWTNYRARTYWPNALTFARNDHVFAVSDSVRLSIRYPAALRFMGRVPVETLYHGLDLAAIRGRASADGVRAEFDIPEDVPVVINVANFRPQKRHALLLRAAAEVRARSPEVRFLLVGQGPLEGATRRLARRLGLTDNVTFTGFRDDVPRLLAASDVFALPSSWEGLSIALLEAMALGKPCVVTRIGGVSEVIGGGEFGVVVDEGDPRGFADALLRLLGDPAEARRLGEAGKERAGAFDIRPAVKREEDVYVRLLGGRE